MATPEAHRSEHHGPLLSLGLLPGVGDAVNLQPGRVEQGQQITLVAELNGGVVAGFGRSPPPAG